MSDNELKVKPVIDDKQLLSDLNNTLKGLGDSIKKNVEKPLNDSFEKPLPKKIPQKLGKSFGQEFSDGILGSLALPNLASGFFLAEKAIGALTVAGKQLFDVFEGEKLAKIDQNFENLANSFGLAGDKLKSDLIAATGGLFDDDDAIKSLTEKIVTFSGKVERFPELFTQARKAANLFGGDAQQIFEQFAFAAQTGATRGLRFIFPKLDLDKEIANYAASVGKLPTELKEAELQQIRLNKILEEANIKLKEVPLNLNTATEAYQRFGVASENAFERFKVSVAKGPIGNATKDFFNDLTNFFDGPSTGVFREKLTSAEQATEKLAKLQDRIAQLRDKQGRSNVIRQRSLENEIIGYEKEVERVNNFLDQIAEKQGQVVQKDNSVSEPTQVSGPSAKFLQAQKEVRQKYLNELLNAEISFNNNLLNNKITTEAKIKALETSFKNQKLLEDQKYQTSVDNIAQDLLAKKLISEEEYENKSYQTNETYLMSLENARKAHQIRVQQAEAEHQEKLRALRDQQLIGELNNSIETQNAIEQAMAGVRATVINTKNSFGEQMRQIGQQAFNALGQQAGKAFLSFAKGAKSGGEALSDFFDSFIGTMGEMLVMSGFNYLLQGIAASLLGLPNGPALMQVGGTMIAFGGVLAAIGGKSESTPSTSGGGVGGGDLGVSSESPIATAPEETAAREPKAQVALNFYGPVLDRKESGLAMAEILEDAFREQDIRVV